MKNWTKTAHSGTPLTLQNVDVWTADRVRKNYDITVTNGFVTDLRPAVNPTPRTRRIVVMPSAVDTQVHLRTPGQWDKETPETGLHAALKGGVGSLLTMPNTKPVLDSVEALKLAESQIAAAELRYGIRVMYSVAGTIGQQGKTVAPIEDLVANGACAITDDGRGISDDQVQLQVFEAAARSGAPFLQHAETLGAEGPLADGPVPRSLGLKPYGAHHETDMVARDLKLLEKVPNARYHLLHTSAAGSLPLVHEAKKKGLRVTAEVSPHHLFFSSDEIDAQNKSFKMNPPIRSGQDREALIDALRDGLIDWVATDHAPHEAATKQKPFAEASFGTLGLETMVPVVLDLVAKGRLSATRAVQVVSTAPAKFLGVDSEFGFIKMGSPARLTIVAPDEAWTVHGSEHVSLSKNTCFDGVRLTGKVVGQINRSGVWLAEEI